MTENNWCDKNTEKELSPPFVVEKDKDYYQSLEEKLILLKNNIKSLNIDEENETNILSTIDSVLEVFSNYYSGDMKNAISIMEEIIKRLTDTFIITNLSDAMGQFYDSSYSLENMYLFRARISDRVRDFSCDDMKHIPFFMRERVPNCRFSMNGIPCLYLGNTSYDCWLELGRPAEHKFHVCAMKLKKDKKILNLTISNGDIFSKDIKSLDFVNYVKILILKICTSYTVEQEGRSFKSEYIFPQLMTIVCDKLMDGIVYFSKRVSEEVFALPAINVVLFSKYGNENSKYGTICSDLIIGDPINYSCFKQVYDPILNNCVSKTPHFKYIANIGKITCQQAYEETWFAKLDNYLIRELEKRKNND